MEGKLFKATKTFQDIMRWGIKNEQNSSRNDGVSSYDTMVFDTTIEEKLQVSLFFGGEKIADSINFDFKLGDRLTLKDLHGLVDIQYFKETEEYPLPEIFETIDSVPSCSCYKCKTACMHKPGWFIPQQLPSLYEKFNVNTIQDLLDTGYFAIDWYENINSGDILVLAPNIKENNSIQYPGDPTGICVFFGDDESCDIYENRPIECKTMHHSEAWNLSGSGMHRKVALEWAGSGILEKFRDQIEIEPYEDSLIDGT